MLSCLNQRGFWSIGKPHLTDVTYSLLGELSGLLVLGVSEELHNSLLVRRESGNLHMRRKMNK